MKVIVIGAGFSGLAACRALRLSRHASVDVTVLEGSARVGGRAHTVRLDHIGLAELGATWLHGLVGHPIYDLALEHGLMDGTEKRTPRRQWGQVQIVREGVAQPLSQQEVGTVTAATKAYANAVEEAQEPVHAADMDASIGDYLRQRWSELGRSRGNKELWAEAWQQRERLQRAMDGAHSTNLLSAAGMAEYYELPGPNLPLPPGYQRMAEILAEGLDIRYGQRVTRIQWSSNGVDVACSSGEEYHADAVIVTVSLGVLKEEHLRMFQPPLPGDKAEAVARLGMGIVDKVFVTFHGVPGGKHPYRSVLSYQLLWKADPADPLGVGSHSASRAPVEEAATQARAGAAGDSEAPAWIRGAYSLRLWGPEFLTGTRKRQAAGQGIVTSPAAAATVPDDTLQAEGGGRIHQGGCVDGADALPANALPSSAGLEPGVGAAGEDLCAVLWLSGQSAIDMEAASDEEVRRGILAMLDAFPCIDLPRRFSVVRSAWGADPLARGSYSYVTPGTSGSHIDALAAPLVAPARLEGGRARPVVCIAGEHTHRHHFGTVHGAYFSGERAAAHILDYLEAAAEQEGSSKPSGA